MYFPLEIPCFFMSKFGLYFYIVLTNKTTTDIALMIWARMIHQ